MSEEWLCSDSKCNRWNAGHRSKCIACGKQRPPAKESGRQNSKFLGDWYCSRCGSVNWSRTQTCDMCNSPRFGDNIGDQQRKGFSETLEYISRYENVRRNLRDKDKDFGRRRKSQRLTADEFRRVYLFLYNLFQFVGYVYILFILSILYAKDGIESMKVAYSALSRVMKFLHLLQILDFLHALLGYTTGSALFAALHLINRLVMLFVMIDGEPRIQTKPVVFYLFALYTLMDVVRYPYYMFRVFKVSISLLTWLRYSMWMPLLPLISFSEGVILLQDISYFQETERFSISLPNPTNFSFYPPNFIRLYLLLGFFPLMCMAMTRHYRQRVNALRSINKDYSKLD